MTTYAIDDDHGNELTTGLQESNVRSVAQRLADERAEPVWTYLIGPHEYIKVEPRTVRCECGEILGDRCAWVGPVADTVVLEYMPPDVRSSHIAAGYRDILSAGRYPSNGAVRIRVHRPFAEQLADAWTRIVSEGP